MGSAPTNTVSALSGRSFTARVNGNHGWRRIARSHALDKRLTNTVNALCGLSLTAQGVGGNHGWRRIARSHALHASSQCCGSGSCTGWCTSGNNGQRSCSEKTGDPIVDFALAPKVLVLDETDQYRWQCCLSLLCRLLNCSCYSFSAAVCLHESVRGVIYDP